MDGVETIASGPLRNIYSVNSEFQGNQKMELGKITARGQTTIPKRIREAANLSEGDLIAFEIEGDHLVIRRVVLGPDGCLQGPSGGLNEWTSPEDEEAWRDL